MASINATIDSSAEHDTAAFLKADEGLAPQWMVGREAGAGNRDEASALGKSRKRRRDMAQGGIGDRTVDMRRSREWRIHQHDARAQRIVQMVVDLSRVVACRRDSGKQLPEQSRAGLRQLVQGQSAARELGEDGEQARAGRRLEHEIGRADRSSAGGDKPERDRRRELLQRLALFGTSRVCRKKRRDLAGAFRSIFLP